MIIIITPYIKNREECRLIDLDRTKRNSNIHLPEPGWYSNSHFDSLCFMYGGKAADRPDILEAESLEEIIDYFDRQYDYSELVHVPLNLHLNLNDLYTIIKSRIFLTFRPIFDHFLDKPFIRYQGDYFQIPVSLADAVNLDSCYQGNSLFRFEEDCSNREINDYLSTGKSRSGISADRVLPMPVGGWCGAAEALKTLGLRNEAYPFDYVRSKLRFITRLIGADSFSDTDFAEVYSEGKTREEIEFVHHDLNSKSTRKSLADRTGRFIERIRSCEKPILFIRTTEKTPDLDEEISESRCFLSTVEERFGRREDKLLLIANFPQISTGKVSILDDGKIMIWNAMGVAGWKVPNNWHLVNNYSKIIAHEISCFGLTNKPNFRKLPLLSEYF